MRWVALSLCPCTTYQTHSTSGCPLRISALRVGLWQIPLSQAVRWPSCNRQQDWGWITYSHARKLPLFWCCIFVALFLFLFWIVVSTSNTIKSWMQSVITALLARVAATLYLTFISIGRQFLFQKNIFFSSEYCNTTPSKTEQLQLFH